MSDVKIKAEKKKNSMKDKKKKPAPQEVVIIPDSDTDGTPLRPIFCLKLKNGMDVRKFDDIDDCFILDFDPDDFRRGTVDRSSENLNPEAEVAVVSEKGPVACRDYPHSSVTAMCVMWLLPARYGKLEQLHIVMPWGKPRAGRLKEPRCGKLLKFLVDADAARVWSV
ncbi:hypothetical protein LINPERHAP2_LOCUS29216 [Linum perenne]